MINKVQQGYFCASGRDMSVWKTMEDTFEHEFLITSAQWISQLRLQFLLHRCSMIGPLAALDAEAVWGSLPVSQHWNPITHTLWHTSSFRSLQVTLTITTGQENDGKRQKIWKRVSILAIFGYGHFWCHKTSLKNSSFFTQLRQLRQLFVPV
jgi:hypothetical protein